jgi:predicted MFS family arabinose efflux permease
MAPGPRVGPNARSAAVLGPVYAATVLSMAAYALISVALPFRFEALGLSVVEYAVVLAAFALGMLALESVWGALAFRIAARRWLVALGGGVGVLFLAVGASTSFGTLALSLGLLGATMIFPVPLMRWLALTASGPGTGGTGTGRYAVFFGAGIVLGSALGPVAFETIGFPWLTVVSAALWAVSVAFLALVPWSRIAPAPSRHSLLRQVRGVVTPRLGAVLLLVVLGYVCYSLTSNFLQYYSVTLFGGSAVDAGYVIGATRGTALIAGLFLGRVVDRWGPSRSPPFGFLLLLAGAVGTFFARDYATMIAATLVFATGTGWLSSNLLPLALAPVPSELQGTAVGVVGSFEDLGLLLGPLLLGAIYATYGPPSTFLFVTFVAAAGVAAAVVLAGLERRSAGAREGARLAPSRGPVEAPAAAGK